ncbi:fused MFS/spermidine synthase [Candidatus Uabimicrobium amorphum]|uniref:Spermidine synthase n=1 Tax=Uabimicrobium amorphum TaxID=2596890 RepID=A0A5S9IUA9_UABAM|nr:fused MFS/spermidine synthase [Candidatus Uabimicrobium amorphum]BBM86745.1 spermidine synthase [Candidatus Uabimicrobium amorphum]
MSTEREHSQSSASTKSLLYTATILFFLSGACSLFYQVIWVKLLTLQFGSSAWSVSTVVSSFMAGLGLGSFWAGRNAKVLKRPFLTYAWLEIAIAVFGLLSLPIFQNLDVIVGFAKHSFPSFFHVIRFIIAFAILLLPTFCMGATLPVLIAGIARFHPMEKTAGTLYGVNTIGAAFGVLACGLFVLPAIGVTKTIIGAAVIGVAIGFLAIYYDKKYQASFEENTSEEQTKQAKTSAPLVLLVIVFLSGFISLSCEISWTRLLLPIVGSSTYAFSIILLTFLIGIGIGGVVATHKMLTKLQYQLNLALFAFVASFSILSSILLVKFLPEFFTSLVQTLGNNFWLLLLAQACIAGVIVVIPAFAMGIMLPLVIVNYHKQIGHRGRAVGEIYAINTLGSILGSIMTGFLLLPTFGAQTTLFFCGTLMLVVAIALFVNASTVTVARRSLWTVGAVTLFAIFFNLNLQTQMGQLYEGYFRGVLTKNKKKETDVEEDSMLFFKYGVCSTITVNRNSFGTWYSSNGKPEASTTRDLPTQYLVGHLPMFFNLQAKNACLIGFGSGATANAMATHPIDKLDVVELEPAVVEVSKYFDTINDNILQNEKLKIHVDDGRSFLRYAPEKYDVIVSEPSNPWIAGVANLFSHEFYQIVDDRLADNGVFCQWIQLYELSEYTLNSMIQTLSDTFPHIHIFIVDMDMICVSSRNKITIDPKSCLERMKQELVAKTLQRIKVNNQHQLFGTYAYTFPDDIQQFPSDQRNNDDNLFLEYRAPLEMYGNFNAKVHIKNWEKKFPRIAKAFFGNEPQDSFNLAMAKAIDSSFFPERADSIATLLKLTQDKDIQSQIEKLKESAEGKRHSQVRLKKTYDTIYDSIRTFQYGKAEKLLNSVISLQVGYSRAHYLLGWLYFQQQQHKRAVSFLEQAIEISPHNYYARNLLATILLNTKRDKVGAKDHLQKSIESNPHDEGAWIILAQMIRNDAEALEKLKQRAQQELSRENYQKFLSFLKPN